MNRPKESDWKQYSSIIEKIRDRFLQKKNQKAIEILSNPESTPTKNFWNTLEELIRIRKILHDSLGEHSRSSMFLQMLIMYRHGMLLEEDLKEFSNELQEEIKRFV